MNKIFVISTSIAIMMAASSAIACDYPKRVKVPNGASATKEDMLAGQSSVKAYVAEMEEYLACIADEEAATLATMTDLSDEERLNRDAALTKKHNAAVEEMELVAAEFNEAVREYKAQSSD
jgi:hypothetical protein